MGSGGSTALIDGERPVIEEGSAKIYFPETVSADEVFYNPVQVFNRDLTCLVLRAFREMYEGDITIFEAFSASGLRSIRYAKEIDGITKIIANDLDPKAVAVIKRNIALNGVGSIVKDSTGDAALILDSKRREFQVIDLDPYSTAAPFIDGAVQAAVNGGLLCVTSTDGRSLCGNQPDTAYAWYGSMPMHTDFSHEFGIRMLLTTIMRAASKYGRSVEPLLSLKANFYFRVFVRIWDHRGDSKVTASEQGLCFFSPDSGSFWLQPMGTCHQKDTSRSIKNASLDIPYLKDPWTGCNLKIGGPVYLGPLHNVTFCEKLMSLLPKMRYITTSPRIQATLYACMAELTTPFYYSIDSLCGLVKSPCPPRAMIVTALKKHGYECSLSHCNPGMLKTTAPPEVIWDFIRTFYLAEKKKLPEDPKARKILGAPNTVEISLEIDEDIKYQLLQDKKRCKFYETPKGFGPKAAAKSKK